MLEFPSRTASGLVLLPDLALILVTPTVTSGLLVGSAAQSITIVG
ncbi:hypothetical protein [Streptococcus sp. E29BA]